MQICAQRALSLTGHPLQDGIAWYRNGWIALWDAMAMVMVLSKCEMMVDDVVGGKHSGEKYLTPGSRIDHKKV